MTYRKNTQLYYCSAGGHLWYYDDNDEDNETPLYYKSIREATDEETENTEDKYCGCND